MGLILTIGAGALAAGFVSGLAGFGTGLVALGFWLHVIDPLLAAPLVVICSVVAQAQSILVVRRGIRPARLAGANDGIDSCRLACLGDRGITCLTMYLSG